MSAVGHNSGDILPSDVQNMLKSYVERIERLNEEKAEIAEQAKEVFSEAKGNGFDTKVLRKLISIRKMDRAKWKEEQAILDLYAHAMGLDLF